MIVCAAAIAAMTSAPSAAAAADVGAISGPDQSRAAFAGASLVLPFGGRAAVPQARLGIGLTSYQRDGSGAWLARGGPAMPVAAGLADGRLQLLVGGQSLGQVERRLEAAGSTRTALIVIGALAAGAAAVVLLADGDDDDGPCPPGVEVCAF